MVIDKKQKEWGLYRKKEPVQVEKNRIFGVYKKGAFVFSPLHKVVNQSTQAE